jgi:hypothetical protein
MNDNSTKANWFARTGIIVLVLFLAALVSVSFLVRDPHYDITTGMIIILAMMIILVLSESFNKFSLGKLLSLSREVQKVAEEKAEIKRENAELRQSLVHVATHIQSQVNTTIQAQGADILRLLGVVKADKKEKEEEQERVETVSAPPTTFPSHRLLPHVEELALNKYVTKYSLPPTEILRDIRFTEAFECIDPISNRAVMFDGYLKTPQKEYFFEVKLHNRMSPMLWDRLYVMISKILLYRQAKTIQAELVLILAKLPEEAPHSMGYPFERFIEMFQPAIAGNLLRIETVEVTQEEYTRIEGKVRNVADK